MLNTIVKGLKRLRVSGLLATCSIMVIVTGCSSAQPESTTDHTSVLTMMNVYNGEKAPKDDDAGMKFIQKITGVELDMTWVPGNVDQERLNVTMASGEMPMIMMVTSPFQSNVLNGIRAGMFWDLGPYLNEFPNLKTYHPLIMDNAKIDGKLYMLPRPRPIAREGTIIREDWLTKVGMKPPSTLDDFYQLAKAFKEQDPDGNGQHDTYGYMIYEGILPKSIFAAFGVPNNWKVVNRQFIKDVETPEYLSALKFLRKMYNEGIINPEFPVVVRNEARKELYTNKVGMSIEAVDSVIPLYYREMEAIGNPVGWTVAPALEGRTYGSIGFAGGFMIPKSSVKTEKELRNILAYFDTLRRPEVMDQISDFMKASVTSAQKVDTSAFTVQIISDTLMYARPGTTREDLVGQRLKEYGDAAITDPTVGLTTPTQTEKGGQLNTILEDGSIQFILGKIDEAGFKHVVEEWKKVGGTQVANELAKLYSK